MEIVPDTSRPIARVAAELNVPLATLRYWMAKDNLPSELRKQGRTRVLYLPEYTINALKTRKQGALPVTMPYQESVFEQEPLPVSFLPPLQVPAAEIELPPLPPELTETDTVRAVFVRPERKRGHIRLWSILSVIGLRVIRFLLAIHTSEKAADWIVGPIVYQGQSAKAMKLRR